VTTKFVWMDELVASVPDGARLGVGGTLLTRQPLAAIDALARRRPKRLTYIGWGGGLPLEMLLGADAVEKILFCFSSLDVFGLAPLFRSAIEEGLVEIEEWPAFAFTAALEAAKQNQPSMPFRLPAGSDLVTGRLNVLPSPDSTPEIPTALAPRIDVDVFLVHGARADELGNVEFTGARGSDALAPFGARRVLATVEEIVPTGELGQLKESFVIPRQFVDMVAVVPLGAYPTSCLPYYSSDFSALHTMTALSPPERPSSVPALDEEFVRESAGLNVNDVRSALRSVKSASDSELSTPATTDEIMTYWIASQLDNDSVASAGAVSPLAITAYLLAKATHAPNLTIMMTSGGIVDIASRPMLLGLGEALDVGTAAILCGGEDTYRWYYQHGLVTCEVVTAAQIDRHGRTNNIEVVSPSGRRVRLPGQGGMADVADLHQNFFLYLPRQSTLNFVDAVSRTSASRTLHTDVERRQAGLLPGRSALITNLAAFEFNVEANEYELSSLHPGVGVSDVQAATGFDVRVAADVAETPSPPRDVLRVLRQEVDPLGIRRVEFVPSKERQDVLRECIAAERAVVNAALESRRGG
jgi:glutaconate CoA-transferase, subunit A